MEPTVQKVNPVPPVFQELVAHQDHSQSALKGPKDPPDPQA